MQIIFYWTDPGDTWEWQERLWYWILTVAHQSYFNDNREYKTGLVTLVRNTWQNQFSCQECENKVKLKTRLKNHLKEIYVEFLFSCDQCE